MKPCDGHDLAATNNSRAVAVARGSGFRPAAPPRGRPGPPECEPGCPCRRLAGNAVFPYLPKINRDRCKLC